MKMNIVIMEDKKVEADYLKKQLEDWSIQTKFSIIIKCYTSGEEFFIQNGCIESITVFFLDIQLGKLSGVDIARKLRNCGYQGYIIFLTAFREYVFDGYEVRALNYLLKPVQQKPLFSCLNEIANNMIGNSYLYRNKQEIIRIPYKEILCFSSSLHYVDILTTLHSYCQYSTLNHIMEHLPNEFIRTHRSYIVNMVHIYKIVKQKIVLSNHMTIPIGRSYLNSVVFAFSNYSTRYDEKRV